MKTKTKTKTKTKKSNSKKLEVKKLVVKKSANKLTVKPSPKLSFQYAPAPEASDIVKIKSSYGLFIDGKFTEPQSDKYFDTINPATGKRLAKVAEAGTKDVDRAVKAATKAYENVWSKMSGKDRGRYLFRIARIMQERSRELAVLETMDNGKPIKESRDFDVPLSSAHFFYYAGWADKLEYVLSGKSARPLGVAAQVIPWNFPLLMAAWKIAPALAAGNTVVLKPAETTSLTALLLADIFQEAGLPDGVVNIITGAGETGAALVNHPGVQKVAFTGSTEVGKRIAQAIAPTNKRLTLELGGKSAQIVFEDAALDQAVEGVIGGIYFNQGHVCCAGSRLLVQESIQDIFLKKLKRRMQGLRTGDPLDKNTDVGAINSAEQLKKIQWLVEVAKKEGGEYYETSGTLPTQGYFHKPCLISNASASSTINRVEVFGPVLSVSTFRNPAEAIAKANDSQYGLAAGVWSEKGAKVHQVAQGLKAGVVWANTYNKFDPSSPFGGYRESGWGREGGRHGLLPYLEVE